jgi:hypothetical protein
LRRPDDRHRRARHRRVNQLRARIIAVQKETTALQVGGGEVQPYFQVAKRLHTGRNIPGDEMAAGRSTVEAILAEEESQRLREMAFRENVLSFCIQPRLREPLIAPQGRLCRDKRGI